VQRILKTFLLSTAFVAAAAASPASHGGGKATSAEAKFNGAIFDAQVRLDRAGFAPGVIDGRKGMSFEQAVKGFQEARGLSVTGQIDQPTWQALTADGSSTLVRLRVDESDAKGPFVGAIPKDPAEQAKMPSLGYRNLIEKLAEKFHTTPDTIVELNDPKQVLRAGTILRLPNVIPASRNYSGDLKPDARQMLSDLNVGADLPKADKVVVDKSDGVLRAYQGDKLVAQFPATMGSVHDPLPIGTWKITTIGYNPPFHFNPALFWDAKPGQKEEMLPPGPNGPVGVAWLDLTKEHYGIHGTPAPETIQRAESHGCVRLTNWDVARLSRMIKPGTPAIFQE
jgi:lipoprotein-anchoring transpeptidase ErfK/SrfK